MSAAEPPAWVDEPYDEHVFSEPLNRAAHKDGRADLWITAEKPCAWLRRLVAEAEAGVNGAHPVPA